MTILLHFHYTSFTSRHYPAQFNFETMFISKLENKDAKIGKWSKYLWSIYILMKMFHVSVRSYLLSSFLFIVTFFKLSWRKCQIPISKKIRVLSDDDLFDCLDSNAAIVWTSYQLYWLVTVTTSLGKVLRATLRSSW